MLFVVDSVDTKRFQEAKDALQRVLSHRELAGAPLLIAANKQDRDSSTSAARVADMLDVSTLASSRPSRVQPVSAITGEGVREAVTWMVDEIQKSSRAVTIRQRANKA